MASDGSNAKRFRSSTACTTCRQMKLKCDRAERLPNRCTRCQTRDSVCQTSRTFKRRRMKGRSDDAEVRRLRHELEQLRAHVASLPAQMPAVADASSRSSISTTTSRLFTQGSIIENLQSTLDRDAGNIKVLSGQIDLAFMTFFHDMHPFLPFIQEMTPNACYEQQPFLFWTICMLGFRSCAPDLSKSLSSYVNFEALQAPLRSCHSQAAATPIIQGLLLLSLWPFRCASLLHEAAWLHCGTATHLALHVGLHQPYAASEFIPKSDTDHKRTSFTDLRRTWIACYVINVFISFARGYPCTARADYNIIKCTQSTPSQLSIAPELYSALLIARRMEEGQEIGSSCTGEYGHVDPSCREGIYKLLQSRLLETEKQMSSLSPYMAVIFMAAKLQPQIQVLQATSPLALQETTVLEAYDTAAQVINLARLVQNQSNMVHLPILADTLVMMSALLIFKIQISRFSTLIDLNSAQMEIAEAVSYMRDGINDFNSIPERVSKFLEALYSMVVGGHLPVGGFIIENTTARCSQNIVYEVRHVQVLVMTTIY